jgi:glutathione S-transferase
MKLLYSPLSPFARKVILAARELGLDLALEAVMVTPVSPDDQVSAANPLGKIPVLVLEDGTAIYDSRVIVDYFDGLTARALAPREGLARARVLTELAAADGLTDAALLLRYEGALRPEPLRWADWTAGQLGKIRRALDLFEASDRRSGDDLTVADIALACGLGYLDFRLPQEDWRASHPKLADFHARICQRPGWAESAPGRV